MSSSTTNERISSNIYLVNFFIYSPILCQKEGQEDRKILYFTPSDVDLGQQVRTIGYCEGLVKFTETFGFDDPCDSIHFQKTRLLFLQAEPEICFAMTLHVPAVERKKDDKFVTEFYDECINDRIFRPMLRIAHQFFVLQNGWISWILERMSPEAVREILKNHFDKFCQNHFHSMIRDGNIDFCYNGLFFLPIEKKLYGNLQSVLRRVETRFRNLKEMIVFYRDQILWSGFPQEETSLFNAFFRLYFWPNLKNSPLSSAPQFLSVDTSAVIADQLRFSSTSNDETNQKFFLGDSQVPYRVLAIRIHLATIFCFFKDGDDIVDLNLVNNGVVEMLRKELETMMNNLEEHLKKKYPTTDNTVRSIYFNRLNMAFSSTIDWTRDPTNSVQLAISALAEDIQWFHRSAEIMVKRENDPWIIAKRSDVRELILAVNQRNANLKEINDKVKQIFSNQFNSIMLIK